MLDPDIALKARVIAYSQGIAISQFLEPHVIRLVNRVWKKFHLKKVA